MNYDFMNQFSDEKLGEFWVILNHWGWPDEIPDPEQATGPIMERKTPRRSAIMDEIRSRIGHKMCLRIGNKDSMSDEEFEDFWKGNYEGDKGAKLRDGARTWAKVLRKYYD